MYRVDRVRRLRPPPPSAVVVPSAAQASGETDRLATSAIPTPHRKQLLFKSVRRALPNVCSKALLVTQRQTNSIALDLSRREGI